MRALFIASIMLILTACDSQFTISDVEAVGFQKEQQQFYTMIGALDGWSGILENEVVELYQFESVRFEMPASFKTATDKGNLSEWKDICRVKNLLMLSKGKKACLKLKTLD